MLYVLTHGETAARFHVSTFNGSGNQVCICAGVGIGVNPGGVTLARMSPLH